MVAPRGRSGVAAHVPAREPVQATHHAGVRLHAPHVDDRPRGERRPERKLWIAVDHERQVGGGSLQSGFKRALHLPEERYHPLTDGPQPLGAPPDREHHPQRHAPQPQLERNGTALHPRQPNVALLCRTQEGEPRAHSG